MTPAQKLKAALDRIAGEAHREVLRPIGDARVGEHYPNMGWYLGNGAYIEGDGREHMWYREGDRILGIEWYFGQDYNANARCVYSDDWETWRPPHNDEPISKEKRREIAARIATWKESKIIDLVTRPKSGQAGY